MELRVLRYFLMVAKERKYNKSCKTALYNTTNIVQAAFIT